MCSGVHHTIQGDHAIVKPPNELEVAMTIAHIFQTQPADKKDLAKPVAQAAAGMPPCRSYIKSIGDLVASYAGGESFQLLRCLDFMCCSVALMQKDDTNAGLWWWWKKGLDWGRWKDTTELWHVV